MPARTPRQCVQPSGGSANWYNQFEKLLLRLCKSLTYGPGDGSVGKILMAQCEFRFTEPTSVLGGHGGLPVVLTLRILKWSPLNNLPS